MVTITFTTFAAYKDYITDLGVANPNRSAPYRFHSLAGNGTVDKIVEVGVGGAVVFLYDAPLGEALQPTDPWFAANTNLNYPASVLVKDIS